MNKLIWRLFEMLRELVPPTADNTHKLSEWARDFHAAAGDPMQQESQAPAKEEESDDPPFDADQEEELDELDAPDDEPHAPKKKKRL